MRLMDLATIKESTMLSTRITRSGTIIVQSKILGIWTDTQYTLVYDKSLHGYSVLWAGQVISTMHTSENIALSWILENRY